YPLSKVPTDLSEIDDLISVVYDVLIAKLRITQSLEYSNNPTDKTSINSNEALKKRLKKKVINRRQENDDYEFPSSQKTPKKRK
ncbi:8607_t:CDS:2, partial [Funneliformis geosporum]